MRSTICCLLQHTNNEQRKTKTHADAIVAIQKFYRSPKAMSYIKTIHKPNKM